MIIVPLMFTVAEGIERRTISVEPGALHNGFWYQVPLQLVYPSKVQIYKPP